MGRETKFGLTLIAVLLVIFGMLLVRRIRGPVTASQQPPGVKKSSEPRSGGPKLNPPKTHTHTTASQKASRYEDVKWSSSRQSAGATTTYRKPAATDRYAGGGGSKSGEHHARFSVDGKDQAFEPFPDPPAPLHPAGSAQAGDRYGMRGGQSSNHAHHQHGTHQHYGSTFDGGYRDTTTPRMNVTPAARAANALRRAAATGLSAAVPLHGNSGKYHVEPGDSYYTIAKKVYGDSGLFKALQEHNLTWIPDPSDLQVGDEIDTPPIAELREKYAGLCPKVRGRKPGTPAVSAMSTLSLRGGKTYTVQEGDTLFNIARYELGDAQKWPQIYQLNRQSIGEDIDYLRPGSKLVLPAESGSQTQEVLTQQPGGNLLR